MYGAQLHLVPPAVGNEDCGRFAVKGTVGRAAPPADTESIYYA